MTITELIAELAQYEGHLEVGLMLTNDYPQYVELAAFNEAHEIEATFMDVALRPVVAIDEAQMKADAAWRAEQEAI